MKHALMIGVAMALACGSAVADTVADFYRGRNIQLLIGGNAGVSYDLAGRTLATHIVKYIPGNPTISVENMPGASSLIMTNHLYNRARRDGSVIGAPLNNILLEPRLKLLSQQGSSVQFDLSRFNWIGSPVSYVGVAHKWCAFDCRFARRQDHHGRHGSWG